MKTSNDEQFTSCKNPATGEEIGRSPLHSIEDLNNAVIKAGEAQKEWNALTPRERALKIRLIRDYLVENADQLAETIMNDNGKTRTDALATEILPSAMAVDYYCRNTGKFLKDRSAGFGNLALCFKRSRLVRIPFGVVGIISPWNYPFSIPFAEVIMAFLAGNAVILKVATETQMVGLAIDQAVRAADLPENLFTYINLPGRTAGDAFLESGIDKLFFTGSVTVGKYLMKKASERLTPLCLELGGNDAMLVCEDADLERAAAGAVWAGFQNGGQSCGGVERIYVHKKIYEKFLEILKKRTEALRLGNIDSPMTDIGTMTTEQQVLVVQEHIDDALSKGATILAQSPLPSSGADGNKIQNLLPPMVLINVNHDMKIMKDETFGPALGVMAVEDMEHAVKLANDSYLGLTSSVWSKDRKGAAIIARKIQAGTVTINDHLMSHGLHETSWGGFKESGIGRSHGRLGFDEMTQPQFIVDDLMSFAKKQLWWHPFNESVYNGLKGIGDFLYGKRIIVRIKGLCSLLRIFPRIFKA